MAKELPLRSDIDSQYKWRLEDIYATDDDWEKDFEKVQGDDAKIGCLPGKPGFIQ